MSKKGVKEKTITSFRNSFKLLRYAFKFSKELVILKFVWIFVKLAKTIFVDIWLLKYLLDAITYGKPFQNVLQFIVFCVIIAFAEMYMDDWIRDYIQPIAKDKIHLGVQQMIFHKILKTDLKNFDDAKFYNQYIWALEKVEDEIFSCLNNFSNLLLSVVSIGSIGALLLNIKPVSVLFALLPMIFVLVISPIYNKEEYRCSKEINPISRRKKYSGRVFYLKDYMRDLRMTGIGRVLIKNHEESVEKEIGLYKKYGKRKFFLHAIQDGSYGLFQMLGLYVYLAYQVIVKKEFSVGTCSAVISAVDRLNGYFYQITSAWFAIYRNGLFANDFFVFLDSKSEIEEEGKEENCEKIKAAPFEELKIEHLAFAYPNSPVPVLNGIDFTIKRGEKVALVGQNGAGKTTFIRLLLRLYKPLAGEIYYNSADINDIDLQSYRSRFGTVFQNPQIYAVTLKENVQMDLKQEAESAEENNAIWTALKRAKLSVDVSDIDKNVTREYDSEGVEFSGGERQKLAIARVLYDKREIILMDEASAALDPISESEINHILLEELKDETVLIVTHRLTTVRHVDRIVYMEDGKIVEEGTHEQLIALGGRYARLYEAQAKEYRDD